MHRMTPHERDGLVGCDVVCYKALFLVPSVLGGSLHLSGNLSISLLYVWRTGHQPGYTRSKATGDLYTLVLIHNEAPQQLTKRPATISCTARGSGSCATAVRTS